VARRINIKRLGRAREEILPASWSDAPEDAGVMINQADMRAPDRKSKSWSVPGNAALASE